MKHHLVTLLSLLACTAGWQGFTQTAEIHKFLNLDRAIPDGSATGLSDRHTVTSAITSLDRLKVKLRVHGQYNGDLYAYLRLVQSDTTHFAVLLNRVGRTEATPWGYDDAGLDVTFDDHATNGNIHDYSSVAPPPAGTPLTGAWQSDGRNVNPMDVLDSSPVTTSLAAFEGANPNGEWTLFVADMDSGAIHTLVSWELEMTGVALPDITWPTPPDIVYGTALGPAQLNASSTIPGTFTYTPPTGTILPAGATQTLNVTFTPASSTSFAPITAHDSLYVLKKDLTISAADTSKVYGAPLPTLTATYAGFVAGDSAASLHTPPTLATGATPSSSAGTYPITVSGAADSNYTITFVSGTLLVTPAVTSGTLTTSTNPALPGQPVTFTLGLTAVAPGAGTPTGTAQFVLDSVNTAEPSTLSNGIVRVTLSILDAGWHTVTAVYGGDLNFTGVTITLLPNQLINSAPVAGTDTIAWDPTGGAKIAVTTLLANDSDPDGDATELVSISSTSARGGIITIDGEWVHYVPPADQNDDDSFAYTIRDGYGTEATGTVVLLRTVSDVPAPNLFLTNMGNGNLLLSFDGIPGLTYRVEFSELLAPPVWQTLGSATADAFGRFRFADSVPPGLPERFYRSVYP